MNRLAEMFYATFIEEDRYLFFVDGLRVTLLLTLASFLFGSVMGAVLCAAKQSRHKLLARIADTAVVSFLQIPTTLLLMLFAYIVFAQSGISLMLVVLWALALKAACSMSNIFQTALLTVSRGELEAARALGMNRWQAFSRVALPQIADAVMPLYQDQFITIMQETSVVGYLALMDLTKAGDIITSRTLDALFGLLTVTAIYFVIGFIARRLLNLLGRAARMGGRIHD